MTTNPTLPSSPSDTPTPQPKPRKHRLRKFLLTLLVLLIVLIALLPTLLSTGLGNRVLRSLINSRIPGTISFDSLSIGYFSGTKITNLKLLDPKNQPVLLAPTFDSELSLIDIYRQNLHGNLTLNIDQINYITYADGTTNVSRSFSAAPALPDDAVAPPAPNAILFEGHHPVTFQLSGKLTSEPGLKQYQLLTIPPATWNFDHIAIPASGMDIGKGAITLGIQNQSLSITLTDIPMNNGTLNLITRVDLAPAVPVMLIEKEQQVLTNFKLNKQFAAGPLSFLPLAWGAKGEQLNLLEVAGTLQVQISNAHLPLQSAELEKTGTLAGKLSILHLSSNAPMFAAVTSNLPMLKMGNNAQVVKDQNIENVLFNLKDSRISYEHLKLAFGTVGLDFSGSVGTDKSLAMNLTVSEKTLNIPVPVTLAGTTAEPKLKTSKESINKTVEQALPGLLERFAKPKK